jgi:erythromycin esterase
MEKALVAKDEVKLSALLTDSFYQRLIDGTIETREAFIRDETGPNSGMTRSSLKYKITKLTVLANEAIAHAAYSYTGTYSVNGVPKPFKGVVHLTDAWSRGRDGTWRLRTSTLHDAIAYVDGKLIENEREQLPPTNATIAEWRQRAVPIPTLALTADPNQLAGIGAAIGDARIVGMGEGSHGTSEFFAFKNRLFKYLVEKKGFTIFAMEAYWGAGLYVDRFIKTGQGTAAQAVASLAFWTWDTPEVVNLVQWMRDYNAKPGNHPILSFVGIDMQNPTGAIGYLAMYLRLHDPAETTTAHEALACAAEAASRYRATPTAGCRQEVVAVGEQLDTLKNAPDITIAQRSLTTILQYLDWKSVSDDARLGARDQDMADNLEWLAAANPRAKVAVWAHNFHIMTSPLLSGSEEVNARPMGAYLRSAFGKGYYAIGQTFGSGTVRAIVVGHGLQAVAVPPNQTDTIAELFRPLNTVAFIDLRGLRAGSPLWLFFSTQRSVEEIGATIDPLHPAYEVPMIVPKSFDGLVYAPISTAATDGTHYSEMHHEVRAGDGTVWESSGAGFDDVTTGVSASDATITNSDALNASPNELLRRFDAPSYAGLTVRVTGEIRSDDLLGFAYPMTRAVTSAGSALSSSQGDPISASSLGSWIPFALTLKVPKSASFVDAGFWSEGLGSVQIRNLNVTRATNAAS